MKQSKFLKNQIRSILIISIASLFSAFLNSKLILGIISFLISLIASIVILSKIDKKEDNAKRKTAVYSFLISFWDGLFVGKSAPLAYESAIKYLTGYQDLIPYDEFIESSEKIEAFEYNNELKETCMKEKENESHLPDYLPLINEAKNKCNQTETTICKELNSIQRTLFILSMVLLGFVIIFRLSQNLKTYLSTNTYCIVCAFLFSLMIPSFLYFTNKRYSI